MQRRDGMRDWVLHVFVGICAVEAYWVYLKVDHEELRGPLRCSSALVIHCRSNGLFDERAFEAIFSCTHWASWIWNTYCLASLLSMTREVKERSWCDTRECNNLEGFLMWCSGKPCNASYIGTQRESTQGKNKGRERTLYIHIYIYVYIYIHSLHQLNVFFFSSV